jgi:hypothetical protein
MNGYILSCEIPRGAEFIEIDSDEIVVVKRHTRYDVVRDEPNGPDKGVVIYNGQIPLGYRSHNTDTSIAFWEVGGLSNRIRRAFFLLSSKGRLLSRTQGNDLKMRAS